MPRETNTEAQPTAVETVAPHIEPTAPPTAPHVEPDAPTRITVFGPVVPGAWYGDTIILPAGRAAELVASGMAEMVPDA